MIRATIPTRTLTTVRLAPIARLRRLLVRSHGNIVHNPLFVLEGGRAAADLAEMGAAYIEGEAAERSRLRVRRQLTQHETIDRRAGFRIHRGLGNRPKQSLLTFGIQGVAAKARDRIVHGFFEGGDRHFSLGRLPLRIPEAIEPLGQKHRRQNQNQDKFKSHGISSSAIAHPPRFPLRTCALNLALTRALNLALTRALNCTLTRALTRALACVLT